MNDPVDRLLDERQAMDRGLPGSIVLSLFAHLMLVGGAFAMTLFSPHEPPLKVMDGFVVDFIELHLIGYFHWPTFNVADSAITCGIAMLLLDSVKNPEVEEKEAV